MRLWQKGWCETELRRCRLTMLFVLQLTSMRLYVIACRGSLDLSQCRGLWRKSGADLGFWTFCRWSFDRNVTEHRLGKKLWSTSKFRMNFSGNRKIILFFCKITEFLLNICLCPEKTISISFMISLVTGGRCVKNY